MTDMQERLIELLSEQTLFGLTEKELIELNKLKKQFPQWENDISLELAAAKIGLMDLDAGENLPANLRTKILTNADEYFRRAEKTRNVVSFPTKTKETSRVSTSDAVQTGTNQPFWQWFGWGIAAAACLALAVNLWLTNTRPPKEVEVVKTVEKVQTPTPELSAAQQREQLLASATDVVQTNWTSPKDKKEILGDIVWSNAQQKGFMRLRGLPVTDPNKEAYQLWIVDSTRAEKKPLSGGVFNINQTGEVVVPIDAQLKVQSPKEFKITKEKPAGVVVTSPERVVAIAKI